MRVFLLKTCLYLVFVIILGSIISEIPIADEFIIEKVEKTSYSKLAWNLRLIKSTPEKIDGSIVFLGPSLTQGDIDDSLLIAHNYKAINMGVNHYGNELELWTFQRILPHHPKAVLLHLSKMNLTRLHPMTPLLYRPSKLLENGQALNISFVEFFFKRFSFTVEYLFWITENKSARTENLEPYGVRPERGSFSMDDFNRIPESELNEISEAPIIHTRRFMLSTEKNDNQGLILKRLIRGAKHTLKKSNFLFNTSSQEEFTMRAFELGERNNVFVGELYLPVLADSKNESIFDSTFYESRKTRTLFSIENFTFLNKSEMWVDMNHLSKKGAEAFTNKLIEERLLNGSLQGYE